MKEASRKAWKKVYFFLRRSGLYCSTKGSSKVRKSSQMYFFFFTAFSRSQRISAVLPTFDESCLFVFQEPRHLQYVADLDDLNVYAVVNGRKLYGAPADFTFCIKVTASSQTPTGRSVTVILAAH